MDSVISEAIREIESVVHFRGPVNLSELNVKTLAERHGLSRFQFLRRFSAATRMSVRDYINQTVLGQAAERLLYTDEPVGSIAVASGYASPQAMTQAFRRRFGFPPSALRRELALKPFHGSHSEEDHSGYTWARMLRDYPDLGRELEVRVHRIPAVRLLVRRYLGACIRVPQHWLQFVLDIQESGLNVDLNRRIGLYYDDPRIVPSAQMRYDCAIPWNGDEAPEGFHILELPPREHAVVHHPEGYANDSIGKPYAAILVHWLPDSGRSVSESPGLELYGLDESLQATDDPGLRLTAPLE